MATSVMIDSSVVSEGPFGATSGNVFYDGVGDIVKIVVNHSEHGVLALQTTYRQGDREFKTIHGTVPRPGDKKVDTLELNFPTEYLVQVKGTEGQKQGGYYCVTSLTFITNYRVLGPFGVSDCLKPFQSSPHSKVMGFFGKAGAVLDSIGVFTKPYSCYIVSREGRADKIVEISVDHKSDIISIKTYTQDNKGCLSIPHGGSGPVKGCH